MSPNRRASLALTRALFSETIAKVESSPIIAITTNNSINEKPDLIDRKTCIIVFALILLYKSMYCVIYYNILNIYNYGHLLFYRRRLSGIEKFNN